MINRGQIVMEATTLKALAEELLNKDTSDERLLQLKEEIVDCAYEIEVAIEGEDKEL